MVVFAILALVIVGGGFAYSRLFGARHRPSLTLTYACPEPTATPDAAVVRARFEDMDAPATVTAIDPTHIRLVVGADASSRSLTSALMLPRTLEIAAVDETAMVALAPQLPAGVGASGLSTGPITFDASDAATLALVQPLVAAGRRLVTTCDAPPLGCRGYLVEPTELGNADVQNAVLNVDTDTNRPLVMITLTASGAQRFEELTRRVVHARLAILLDGNAISMPLVREPIPNGHVMLTLATRTHVEEASAIAAVLRGGQLSCSRWSLASEDVTQP